MSESDAPEHDSIGPWVDRNIERMMREVGIPHWRVTVLYEDDLDARMTCRPLPEYERATVRIDRRSCVRELPTWDDFERTLRHELFHCAICNAWRFCETLIHKRLPEDEIPFLMTLLLEAVERDLRNLERLWASVSKETPR